ncbi:MAG: HEAT repeat domain-containing protein [Gemmatimonadota bacterium]
MTRLIFAAVALVGALASVPQIQQQSADTANVRAAWAPGDPADSTYRSAREALNKGDYRKAAGLFHQIRTQYPKSTYAPDACYWEAFALYRTGATTDLRSARSVLAVQRDQYASAATRGDAESLLARIQGELARRGDAVAAEAVTSSATAVAYGPAAPRAPVPPTPGAAMAAPRTPRAPRAVSAGIGSARAVSSSDSDCPDEDDDARVAALNAMIGMDAERAQPVLEKVMARRDAGSSCLRRKAIFLLSQQRTTRTEDILLTAARTDPDPEVREQAVFWLSQVSSPKALAALDSILRTDGNTDLREKAMFALSQQDSPEARKSLRAFAGGNDVPPELQEKAIFWLGQSQNAEDQAFLKTLYPKLADRDLKEKVFFAVAQSHDAENQRWLLSIAGNDKEDIELRKQALFWAGQSGVGVAEMAALYDKSTDSEMREQIIFVLSQSRETAAVDKMLTIAKTEKDKELRKRAIFWLSQSQDPRAAKVLEEILNQ